MSVKTAADNTAATTDSTDPEPVPFPDHVISPEQVDTPGIVSPIMKYLGVRHAGIAGTDLETESQLIDESLTRCMERSGFDWFPDSSEAPPAGARAGVVQTRPADGTVESLGEYGFGYSTTAFSQDQVGDGLIGNPEYSIAGTDARAVGAEGVDLNHQYQQGLAPERRDEYAQTMSACGTEVNDLLSGRRDEFFSEFAPELAQMHAAISADHRLAAFDSRVSSCVEERTDGEFRSREGLEHEIIRRMEPLRRAVSERSGDGNPAQLTEAEREELAEIQAYERQLGAMVVECGADPAERYTLLVEVTIEYEEQFVKSHQERLDEFKARGEKAGS